MSKVEAAVNSNMPKEVLEYHLPENIVLNPKFNIRLAGASDSISDDELMADIKSNGQLEPCRARRTTDGKIELIFGHRRHLMITKLNMEAEPGNEIKVACMVVDADDDQALQQAASENLKRKDMNALEQGNLCLIVREQKSWKGAKNTKNVAEFLGKSPAWVTGREKLTKLPQEAQDKIRDGVLSADAALMLPDVAVEQVGEVIAVATEAQASEPARKGKAGGAGKKGQVKAKHIVAAARKLDAVSDPKKKKRLTVGELADFFSQYRNSIPHLYAPVQDAVIYLLDKFIPGQGSVKTMTAKFDALIAPACHGTKVEPEVDEAEMKEQAKLAAKLAKVKEANDRKLAAAKVKSDARKVADDAKKAAAKVKKDEAKLASKAKADAVKAGKIAKAAEKKANKSGQSGKSTKKAAK